MKTFTLAATAVIVANAFLVTSPALAASLYGDVIHGQDLFPTAATLNADLGSPIAGPGIEFTDVIGVGILDVDVTSTQIVFAWHRPGGLSNAAFNGFEFTDLTNSFTSASLNAVSNTPGAKLTFSGGNVFVNLASVTYFAGENITIDVGTGAVTEPATWTMMITGFGLIGMTVRRRRPGITVVKRSSAKC